MPYLSVMTNVIEAARAALDSEYMKLSATLKAFPRGQFGLPTDAVKASAEWKSAKRACDAAFAALRRFNQQYKPTR